MLARISQKPWKESMTNQHVKNIMKKEAPEMLKRNWVEETEPKARKYIEDKIARIEREAEAEINLHRQKKLREWREKMKSSIKEVSKWMKNKKDVPAALIDGTTNRQTICQLMKNYWKEDWAEEDGAAATRKARIKEYLLDPLEEFLEGHVLPEWNEEEMEHGMFEAFKKARGAGSADGWLGSEIKALPSEMIRRF